jgi:hypothetical protein
MDFHEQFKGELEKVYLKFGKELTKVAEDTLGEIIGTYIPYAFDDYNSNVYMYAHSLIQYFLTDQKPYDDLMSKSDIFSTFNSKEVRAKIFEEYKDKIIQQISEDLIKENERLKEYNKFLEELRDRRYSY